MYIVHTTLREPAPRQRKAKPQQSSFIDKMEHKFFTKAIKEALADHADEIKKIQKHFPGWQPKFVKQ